MTALNSDAQATQPKQNEQLDTNLSQTNVDTNLTQKNVQNPPQKEAEAKESDNHEDPNWKAFREARKKDRLEREAAERKAREKEAEVAALKAAMEVAFSKSAPSPQAYQQYYAMNQYEQPEETEEQRIERKVTELLTKREEKYRIDQIENEKREYPNRIKKDFPDFSQVCSQENLDYLDYHYPEISRPLQRLNEGYDKWHDTYHAVKKLIPNHLNAKKEAMRADMNANKPRSMSSSGPSPTGERPRDSWQEVERRRQDNWERMQRTLKGV